MASPEIPASRRQQLMAEADAEYQRRIDDLRREERKLQLDIESKRAKMREEILFLGRRNRDLVLSGFDILTMSPLDLLNTESVPAKCRRLMEEIEADIDELHRTIAQREKKEECRWQKLAQYLTPEELVELVSTNGSANGAPASSVVRQFDRSQDYRGSFSELVENKPYVTAQNGRGYYDIYVGTSSGQDRVYIGTNPPDSGEKPPRKT